MDIIVAASEEVGIWSLADLLGRPMGSIAQSPLHGFTIRPDGFARETMAGLEPGPHPSLDAALAEIERHTRGVCRRLPAEDRA